MSEEIGKKDSDYLYRKICELIKTRNNLKILYIGCGQGKLLKKVSNHFNKKDLQLIGIDKQRGIIYNNKDIPTSLIFMKANARKIPFPPEFFDLVISKRFFHFLPNKLKVFKEVKRVLKKEGFFISLEFIKENKIKISDRFSIFYYWLVGEEPLPWYFYLKEKDLKKMEKVFSSDLIKNKRLEDKCVRNTKNHFLLIKKS